MNEKLRLLVCQAAEKMGLQLNETDKAKIKIEYPEGKFGDYATNAAFVLAKSAKLSPKELAAKLMKVMLDQNKHTRLPIKHAEMAPSGYINFTLEEEYLLADHKPLTTTDKRGKILLEYFQPNIAKPLHIGHMRTAIIGDSLRRMLEHAGSIVESDTHMGDWGTQFGVLILAYKKYGKAEEIEKEPILELNKLYIRMNEEMEQNPDLRQQAKAEFVKLEQGDSESKKIWKQFVDWSMEKFLAINDLMDILPFDHHWPESFYEDKMPAVIDILKKKKLLVESQGAQIVNLEDQGLGIAVIVKSDTGTTYLLRDLATFIYRKSLGFAKQLYVVDSRQSHHYHQLFAILKMLGETKDEEATHIDYGFISFKGEALSTRKGNMVLANDVIAQAEEKVAKIIAEKNPELAGKDNAVKAIAKGALKYFDLKHNRHSDIEFDWKEVLDFEGDSGPYLMYSYARLASILRKVTPSVSPPNIGGDRGDITSTERELLFQLSILDEKVAEALGDYLPNILANYLSNLATLINKFYHESPVIAETDEAKKQFRLALVDKAKKTLGQGLQLLGIMPLEEM